MEKELKDTAVHTKVQVYERTEEVSIQPLLGKRSLCTIRFGSGRSEEELGW